MADQKSLQVCHCGWTSVTTYDGLRTHQGKKGCTIKGTTITNMFVPKFTCSLPLLGSGFMRENIPRQKEPEKFTDQTEIFGTQSKSTLAEQTTTKDNKPLFGSALQPLQSSDHSNKTRSALDSIVGVQQSNQTSDTAATTNGKENKPLFQSPQQPSEPAVPRAQDFVFSSSALQSNQTSDTAATTNGKENKPLFQSPQQPSEPAVPRAQDFVFSSTAPQAFSNWKNEVKTTKEETKQNYAFHAHSAGSVQEAQPLFTGNTSQKTFDKTFLKPATFNSQPNTSKPADASMDRNFGTLPNFNMFGSKSQTQGDFLWPSSTPQVQMEKTNAQTTAVSNGDPMETTSTNLFKDLLMFDGAPQQPSLGANPVTAMEIKPIFSSPQSQSTFLPTESGTPFTGAFPPFSQIFPTHPGPKTPQGALQEPKPVSFSKPPPSTNLPVASQIGLVNGLPSGPATPKTTLEEESKLFFETPQHSHQSGMEGNRTRRALDFSTGAQQAQTYMAIPTTTSQIILSPMEETKDPAQEEEYLRQLERDRVKAELLEKIRSRQQRLSEIRSHVKACKGSLDDKWLEINTVFSDVIHIVEEARQRALQPLENRKDKLKRDSQILIKIIQEDIEKLEKAIQEVDTADDSDLDALTKQKLKDFRKLTVDTTFSFGTLQSTLSTMMEEAQRALEKLAALELERAPAFAVDVQLDPTSAHQWLLVSSDRKKVQDGGQPQEQLPLAVGRFDLFGSILAANRFSSGRAYWEVQVGDKSGWDLGVASAKANRKGKLTLSPDNGYWAIVHFQGEKYAALTAPPVCLELTKRPQKVGVFVDYEERLVSFYNVTDQSHIYSFTKCSFVNRIAPYFSPHLQQNGENAEPLVITSMEN